MKTLKTFALTLALAHGLALTAQAVTPTKRLTLDIGRPENTFVLGPISRGSTEYIDAALYVRGTAYPTNDLNGYIWYSETGTSTSGVKIANTSSANINGHVYFQVSTAQSLGLSTNASDYPATNYCAVVLTNATQTFSWDVGKLILRWEPALAGAGLASTYPISAVIPGEYITNIVDGAYIEATRSGRDVTLSVTGLTSGASVNTNTIAERAWVEGKGYLTSYTETDPVWVAASNSFARTSGFQMLGNINLNAFTLDNGIVDADQLTTGTVPLSALSSITTNQMQGAAHALYVADTDTDTTYTAGTGIALAGGEFSASGVSTNEMAAATVAQIHAAGGASEMGDLSDVADLSGAAADEVLAYNGTMWTNAASGGGADVKSDYSNTFASVYLSSAQAVGAASTETIEFNAETHDIGGNFNTGTYTYTAPETGIYLIGFSANATSANNGKDVKILVYAGASLLALQTDPNSGGTASSRHMAVSHIQRLTAAQTVYARAVAQSGGGYTLGGTYSKMQIIKISE